MATIARMVGDRSALWLCRQIIGSYGYDPASAQTSWRRYTQDHQNAPP